MPVARSHTIHFTDQLASVILIVGSMSSKYKCVEVCLNKFEPRDRHAVVCGEDQPYCTTELKVDWIGRGSQIYELSRGCSSTKPLEACTETSSKAVKVKFYSNELSF